VQVGPVRLVFGVADGSRVVLRLVAEVPAPPIGADINLVAADALRHRFDPATQNRIAT
jgi:hypothetical protein